MRPVALVLLSAACGGAATSPPRPAQPLSNHVDTPPPPPPVKADPAALARALTEAKILAYETFPQWSVATPSQACPRDVYDMLAYGDLDGLDPWHNPYEVLCGDTLPQGVKGILVVSPGPDGKLGTADDIKSTDL